MPRGVIFLIILVLLLVGGAYFLSIERPRSAADQDRGRRQPMHRPRNRLLLAAAGDSQSRSRRWRRTGPNRFSRPASASPRRRRQPIRNRPRRRATVRPVRRPGAERKRRRGRKRLAGRWQEAADAMVVEIAPPIEMPIRRAPRPVRWSGRCPRRRPDSANVRGVGSSGKFLSILMRRTDTPLASRWGHILLRNALLTKARAPADVHPADWVAERAWLLIRMGEADGARMLVSGVDVDDFTPKLFQVGVQSALANADPVGAVSARTRDRQGRTRSIAPLARAMCASLSGNSAVAAADIEAARRRGRFDPIDLVLADKVVGAGADTARAVTVEWEPVKRLNAWRFGLATATGMVPPATLIECRAPPQVRAWQARAPVLSAEQRLASARIATGLGVFSSQALIDLYSEIYDLTDPSDLAETDAWQAAAGGDRQGSWTTRSARSASLLDGAQGADRARGDPGAAGARGGADRARCRSAGGRARPDRGDAGGRIRSRSGALGASGRRHGRRICRPLLGDAGAWRADHSGTRPGGGRIGDFIDRDTSAWQAAQRLAGGGAGRAGTDQHQRGRAAQPAPRARPGRPVGMDQDRSTARRCGGRRGRWRCSPRSACRHRGSTRCPAFTSST